MKLEVPIYCMALKPSSALLADKIIPNLLTQEGDKLLTKTTMILTQETLSRYRANQGYVYLVHVVGTDRYKTESSVNPVASLERLKQLSPHPLQIVQCFWTPDRFVDEKWFREKFAQYLSLGDWLDFTHNKDEVFWYYQIARPCFIDITHKATLDILGEYYNPEVLVFGEPELNCCHIKAFDNCLFLLQELYAKSVISIDSLKLTVQFTFNVLPDTGNHFSRLFECERSFFFSLQQQCNAFCFGLTGRQLNDVLGLHNGGER